MRTVSTRDKLEFCFQMGRHSTATLADCQRLLRYGATYGRIQEAHCNGDCPYRHSADGNDICTREAQIEKQIEMLVTRAGLVKAVYQGDPRGCTVKLRLPDGYGNDFGGEGLLCVPTS